MSTIEVGKIMTTTNSAAGVKVFHEYYNASEKEIKYITFNYMPYNSVNDVVASTTNGKTEAGGKLTGPIPPKHKSYVSWENMWYNPTITKAVITKILVQFMDNTEELIDGEFVLSMQDPQSEYYNEFGKIDNIRSELNKNWSTSGNHKISLDIFSDINDEVSLLKVLDNVKMYYSTGYVIGDYLEKEYSSNDKVMKKAVFLWKESVAQQQKYYNTSFARSNPDFPQKYAEKIKKYEPDYVIPKKAGCVTIG